MAKAMPILVRWKWQEKTKSYLVIFYFYDDFSKPNLRFGKRQLTYFKDAPMQLFDHDIAGEHAGDGLPVAKPIIKPIMTWAPSHRELALLSDLLHYANMISGFSEEIKRDLRYDLEITVSMGDDLFGLDEKRIEDLDKRFKNPLVLCGREENKESVSETFFCIELSPEYLEYLKDIVKPYI
jgi:hypothetical protein